MMYPNWLSQRAHLSGSRMALSFEDREWTFAELNDMALKYAGMLTTMGVSKNSRVAFLSKSHPQFIMLMYACLHIGCEMVMLNERLSKAELSYQLNDSEVDFTFVEDALQENIVNPSKILFSEVERVEGTSFVADAEWQPERTISIMYTSGTTGHPKGVRQTVENHFSSAVSSALNIGVAPDDVWLCTVPLFHISGFSILMRSLIYGMGVRLHAKFDAEQCADELQKGRVTHMSAVGVTLERVLAKLKELDLEVSPRFKVMLAGGGPIPPNDIQQAGSCGISVLQTYGMTETSSQTTTLQPGDADRKVGSSGKPLFLYQLQIDGALNAGDIGEIRIRGPQVSPGYIGKFANRDIQQDGWLHTGDLGYLDDEGFLYVVDRRSDLIVSGGENIYPAEIENVLLEHSAVRETGVCGIQHEVWGEVPVAFVVLNKTADESELLEFCKTRLASYKVPKWIRQVDALPRNASNKLLRRELKTWT